MGKAESNRKWAEANPDKVRESQRKWRAANSERVREYGRAYRLANPEKSKEALRGYYLRNKAAVLVGQKAYLRTPEGKASAQRGQSARRARVKEMINTLTAEEWQFILESHDFRCAYCGCSLLDSLTPPTRDHIIPISKGGDNTLENTVPACQSCNASKGVKRGDNFWYADSSQLDETRLLCLELALG